MKQPFFVRFLESQEFPEVQTDIHAGRTSYTTKYPSDKDDGILN